MHYFHIRIQFNPTEAHINTNTLNVFLQACNLNLFKTQHKAGLSFQA